MDFRGVFIYPKPSGGTWSFIGWDDTAQGNIWRDISGVRALSTICEVAGNPQYMVYFSYLGGRIDDHWMSAMLKRWGIEDFIEEDAGDLSRMFWRRVDEKKKA